MRNPDHTLILTPSPTECNSELKRTPFTDITPWNTFFPNCLKFLNNIQMHKTEVLVLVNKIDLHTITQTLNVKPNSVLVSLLNFKLSNCVMIGYIL